MRRAVLWKSVRRLLDPDEELHEVAYMWHRHRLALPFALVAGVVLGWVARLSSFGVTSSVAVGLAAFAVGASAATDYRVVAFTDRGLVLLNGGRVRQVAKSPVERLPETAVLERVSNNLVISEWQLGDRRYSVLRRFESAMSAMSAATSQ